MNFYEYIYPWTARFFGEYSDFTVEMKHRKADVNNVVASSVECEDEVGRLDREFKENVKKNKEKADKKREGHIKGQQHKKSNQKHKMYNRNRTLSSDNTATDNDPNDSIDNPDDDCNNCNNENTNGLTNISFGITARTSVDISDTKKRNPFDNNEQYPRVRKAKKITLEIYRCLKEKYDIALVCKLCLAKSTSYKNKYNLLDLDHKCAKNQLALKDEISKTGEWLPIRDVQGSKKKILCHQFLSDLKCRLGSNCPYPHSICEMHAWFTYFQKFSLVHFIDDLCASDLKIRFELTMFYKTYPGYFLYCCASCYKDDQIIERKGKHVAYCKTSKHPWIKKLFYQINVSENKKNCSEIHSAIMKCDHEVCLFFQKLLSFGFKEKDIVLISESLHQSFKHQKNKQQLKRKSFGYDEVDDDYHEPPVTLEEAIEDDKKVEKWTSFPYEGQNEDYKQAVEDEYNSKVFDESGAGYYKMYTTEKLKELLQFQGKKFKRCHFNLKGTNRAICDFLDVDKESKEVNVELRSRKNCGPCFDGDEVVVELKNTKELGDDGKILKRGTVVGVLSHAFDRREYTYLCKIDPHVSHLMIPVNGVGPKIHVMREKMIGYGHKNMVFVYESDKNDTIKLKKSCDLSLEDKEEILFVVKYLNWKFSNMYPLGYICGLLKAGTTIEETQTILDVIYQIPCNYDLDNENDSADENVAVMDLTHLQTVSIDPENARDIDDAISIERLSDGQCNLIVHISDVSHYVSQGGWCDNEALKRMTSYYPVVGPVRSMLPKQLSDNKCSLLEGKKRRTLSVFFHCNELGKIDSEHKPVVKETIIKNKKQLSYGQVQKILEEERPDGSLNSFILFLFNISQTLRKERLRMGWMFRQEKEQPFLNDPSFEAHQLIEEFMILTNMTIAKFVINKFPSVIPLRCQEDPNEEKKNSWMKEWSFILGSSVYFHRYFGDAHPNSEDLVTFLKGTLLKLDEYLQEDGTFKKALRLVGNEMKHPFHAVSLVSWYSIQEKAFYACSGDDNIGQKNHYSLNTNQCKDFYVQFTSPIRRYLDLVVHRFVKAALNGNPTPYSCSEVIQLCNKANIVSVMNKKYSRELTLTRLLKFLEKPFYVPVFVSELDENLTEFISPFLPNLTSRYKKIMYNQLSLSDRPDKQNLHGTSRHDLRMIWDRKIFDACKDVFKQSHARDVKSEEVNIDPKRHVDEVSAILWKEFLVALNGGRKEDIEKKWREVNQSKKSHFNWGSSEVTSEMKDDKVMTRPCAKFSLNLKKGSVLAVQVGAAKCDGYLRPQIKMLNLTNQIDICFCHKKNPMECFVQATKRHTNERYLNINEYLQIWLSILNMEAATTAVNSGDSIMCHNVPIKLQMENDCIFGKLKLESSFCKKRSINIDVPDNEGCGAGDFLCIRFPIENHKQDCEIYESFIQNKWLCHAVSICDDSNNCSNKKKKTEKTISFSFKVQHFDCLPPSELLSSDSVQHATVEFISKPCPEKKMSEALNHLKVSSEICQLIALGHSMDHLRDSLDVPHYDKSQSFDIKQFMTYKNNSIQNMAIYKALTQPFTLIQGPPGTGKTVTAIKTAWWFAKANNERQKGQKVMYCGPSNSSVNVAAEWLKKMGDKCPKIVRVYGKSLERQWYPRPRFSASFCGNVDMFNNYEATIDLHHLIRQNGKPFAEQIVSYDRKFREHLDKPEDIPDYEIKDYEELLDEASKEELKACEIILCTCTASSSSRMKDSNIAQLIIDECGMCKEPESLIPLANYKKIQQVVLIGDHKQLQPIVKNRLASDLGLKMSMFERYKDEAIMLNVQYRMHEAICDFPSKQFYDGKLRSVRKVMLRNYFMENNNLSFWPNPGVPLVFCHVEGAEKSMVVSTSEGNEASRSNEEEAKEVMRIYRELHDCWRSRNYCILTQYKAQRNLIKKYLTLEGNTDVPVSTVVSSQGNEFDFVILSLVCSMPEYEIEKNPSIGWCNKNLGFITDEHQINVALTRAKHGLIIIGNKHLLRCNELFDKLLADYERRKCVIDSIDFKPSSNRFKQPFTGDKFGNKKFRRQNFFNRFS